MEFEYDEVNLRHLLMDNAHRGLTLALIREVADGAAKVFPNRPSPESKWLTHDGRPGSQRSVLDCNYVAAQATISGARSLVGMLTRQNAGSTMTKE
jgi:hypothetical protein